MAAKVDTFPCIVTLGLWCALKGYPAKMYVMHWAADRRHFVSAIVYES